MTPVRERAKTELRRWSPKAYALAELIYVNEVAYAREFFGSGAATRLRRYTREFGWTVIDGPFARMSYPPAIAPFVRDLGSKLIGAYEAGIQDVLDRLIEMQPKRVIDVGSAEGYYAVGLARRLPEARVIAVDIDPVAQLLCRGLALRNGVGDRVATQTQVDLTNRVDAGGSLVFMDCEGAEYELADPVRFPTLAGATVVVELHEFFHRDVLEVLTDRFAATHTVEVHPEHRPTAAIERLSQWPDADVEKLLYERRPEPMRWAVFLPR
jgi:hypothetical protein